MQTQNICLGSLVMFLLWSIPGLAQDINSASEQGDLEQVKVWVEKDPPLVDYKDKEGRTPLHLASRGVHQDVLEYLVENGADVNARDSDNVTPLHSLSYRGNAEAMEILILKGAVVEVKEANGMTPLMYAVYSGQETAVALLFKHGARAETKDSSGATVADIAENQGHAELTQYLLSMGAELTPVADPEITQLSGNIHRITFCYEQCTNMLVVDGEDSVLVIDTGYGRTREKLKTAVNNIGKDKKITIINTHQHHDHIGGNIIAGETGHIISNENLDQMTSRGVLVKNNGGLRGASGTVYEGGYTLKFNHQKIRIIPLPGAHTDGDIAVYLEDAAIVHMGDLLISQSFPSLTRGIKINEYMAILEKVIDIFDDRTLFVGGHGRNLEKPELEAYRHMLEKTIDIIISGMKAGKTAVSMQQEGVLNQYASYDTFIPQLDKEYWIEAVCKNFGDGMVNPPEN